MVCVDIEKKVKTEVSDCEFFFLRGLGFYECST